MGSVSQLRVIELRKTGKESTIVITAYPGLASLSPDTPIELPAVSH